ncbi:MAG: hypothetical protein D6795_19810 [Deltaproteobacteria bacterium]|nr:MAG: hypothetical protein D6795_19810 [Deltaproteobacteria bacterium]
MDAETLRGMKIKELREEAAKHDKIANPHGMNRQELLDALGKVYDIEELQRKTRRKKTPSIRELKRRIKVLQEERGKIENPRRALLLRKRIRRLRRKTRRIARAL